MADKKFTLVFDATMDVGKVKSSVSEIQKALNSLNMSKGMQSSTASIFKNLMNELDNYNTLTSQAATSMADIKKADKSLQSILNLFDKLNSSIEEVGANKLNFVDSQEIKRINSLKNTLEKAKQAMSSATISSKKADLGKQYEEAQKKAGQLKDQVQQLSNTISQRQVNKLGIEKSIENAQEKLKDLRQDLQLLTDNPVTKETRRITKDGVTTTETSNAPEYNQYKAELAQVRTEIRETEKEINKLTTSLKTTDTGKLEQELIILNQSAATAAQEMQSLASKIQGLEDATKQQVLDDLKNELSELLGLAKDSIPDSVEEIESFVSELEEIQRVNVDQVLRKVGSELGSVQREADKATTSLAKGGDQLRELNRAAQDVENLKNQVLDFFSISNTIQIFKDAVRDAFETVKELDAAMTETAVVTDFSIGDMWDKLPEYSEQATKLGTSIKSLYEATTLYYQQGLDSEQAMGVGIETMKMARVANMDAAAATEAMTAALRGFNMEINEMSATRVSDVYSELAAITAADTSQIATAMSKTASIASSANMEFETTAALLAQIIETTQEAPETAGTAMKTIIARFTEVKQLFDQGLLTGEDSEGEEININKIDAALKTVGISLKDFLTGAKGIDDIFLELASKWDTLDLATQRYIATTAAGSRQQSRFLAMMSNYDRTMELVTAANNSAGASQKQFDKTLESLDAKLQRLRNAWQEFTMGLANSDAIKFAVDALTMLLEAVNKLTGLAGNDGFGGIITAVIRLATVIGALKSGGGILNGILKYFKNSGFENIIKIGDNKIDFFGPLLKTTDRAGNDLLGIVEILKDPALRGQAFTMAAANAKGFLAVLAKFAPYVGILLALGAAIKLVYDNSLAGQIEAAKQATERASEKAQEAAQEYDILNNSLDSIGRKASTLENMTRGTQEWKNAVSSLNQEILDLVANYPELAPFIVNKGGVLEIDYDTSKNGITAGDVINSYENRKAGTQVEYAQRQINQKGLESSQYYNQTIGKNLADALIISNVNALQASGISAEEHKRNAIEEWAKKVASGQADAIRSQADLDKWLSDNYFTPGSIDFDSESYKSIFSQLQEYGSYLIQQEAALDGLTSAIVAAEISLMDFKDVPQDVQEAVVNTNSKGLNSIYQKAREKAEKEVDRKTPTREDQEAYARAMGYTISGHGQFTSFYKDGEKQEVKASDVMNFVINDVAGANFSESLTALTETLKGATDNGREMYSAIFGNGVVTSEMLAQYGSVRGGQYWFDQTKMDALAKEMHFGGQADMIAQTGIEDMSSFVQEAFSAGFAEFMKNRQREKEGTAGKFKEFFASEEYKEVNEKLKEIYETQGKITDSDVRSLASEYSNLNSLLEETSTTASGMAIILEGLQDGSITADTLTNSLIGAISNMNSLSEATDKVLQKLRELNLGTDTGEVQDIYGGLVSDANEYYQSGEYGNERLWGILDYTVGKNWRFGEDGGLLSGEDFIASQGKVVEWMNQNLGENMGQGWMNLAQGKGVLDKEVDLAQLAEKGIVLAADGEGMSLEIADTMGFDEAAQILSEFAGGTKELWQDMLIYYSNMSPEFRASWTLADYQNAGKKGLAETTETGKGKFITQEEVDKTNEILQAEAKEKFGENISIEDYETQLREAAQAAGENLVITPSLEGLDTSGIKEALEGVNFFELFMDGKDLDFGSLLSALKSLGLSDTVATEVANGVANGVAQNGGEILNLDGLSETINAELASTVPSLGIDTTQAEGQVKEFRALIDSTFGDLTYDINLGLKFKLFDQEFAKGTKGAPKTGNALVGEEAPELIETDEGAYLSGLGGPEIFPINKGDVVHNAKDTAAIFKRSGKMMPAFKGGTLNLGGSSGGKGSGRGGSGSGAGDKDAWENPFDKLYNLVRNIDEELRQRERIERRYEKLLKSLDVSANKIVAINREELAQLEKERELQEELVRGREWQIQQYLKENQDLLKYANVEKNDRGENVLRIDWNAINAVRDSELGERIEEYVGQLEEWFDSLQDAEEALWDIEDAVEEIKDRGKDQYLDLEDRIKEALIQSYQDEIDKLSEINDSINDTNASLLDAIQTSIDKQRQDRENAETEADLAEKQRRLAYLQQDTSGANAMEILKLEEEIREGQQDYTDSLIDQKISELQRQNDEAAKQREQQISIMQAQLDQYIESGEIWSEVYQLMEEGLDEENGLITGSRLEDILKSAEGFAGLSEIGKMEWLSEIEKQIAEALAYLKTGRQLEDLGIGDMQNFSFIDENDQERTGYVDKDGNIFTHDEEGNFVGYSDVYQGADGKYYAGSGPELIWEGNNTFPYGRPSEQGDLRPGSKGDPVKSLQHALYSLGFLPFQNITGNYDVPTEHAVNAVRRWQGISPAEGFFDGKVRDKLRLLGYETGGLADFTGPAWLDGTKARPELVLNARDTQNFIQLKDILGSLMSRPVNNTATENNGDTNYDIDINVESISNDYDVEKMASKIKSMINQDARYRNNNVVGITR